MTPCDPCKSSLNRADGDEQMRDDHVSLLNVEQMSNTVRVERQPVDEKKDGYTWFIYTKNVSESLHVCVG